MANLSESSHPYYREVSVSLDGNGDFSYNTTQNLLVTRLGNVVNITSNEKLIIGDATATTSQEIEANNPTGGDKYGWSVDISEDGRRVVVGSIYENTRGTQAGSVYVYDHNGTNWAFSFRLDSGISSANEELGRSVSISHDGTVIVGGCNGADVAYVWRYNGSTWDAPQRITGVGSSDFGRRVAANEDGSRIVIGAPGENKAYTYDWNGSCYVQQNQFTAPTTGRFGFGVSISGDGNKVAIGADQASTEGRAWIYGFDGSSWSLENTADAGDALIPSDTGGIGSAQFGNRVGLSQDGSTIIVNAVLDSSRGVQAGSAYMFRWNGTTWIEETKLLPSDGSPAGDLHGLDVAISKDGNKCVVASYRDDSLSTNVGAAYTYTFDGTDWIVDTLSTGSIPNPLVPGSVDDIGFGRSIGMSGDGSIVVAGVEIGHGSVVDSGTAYIFDVPISRTNGEWHSATSVIPDWAVPSTTQSADGSPRNSYDGTIIAGGTADDDLMLDCWVKADGTFVLGLTILSSGADATTSSPTPTSSVYPVNISYVIV